MYTQRAQHKLMLLLPNVYKKSSSHFINELQLPRKAVTTNKKAFVSPDKLQPKKLITNELAKPRNNTCCIESIFNFKVSFTTLPFKFIFSIRAMPFMGQLPQRSQHKMELPSRANRVYRAEVHEPFIGANLQSS